MEFYSFSFGGLKVAQADDASPKIVGVDLNLAFKTVAYPVTVQSVKVHVSVLHQPDQSIEDTERRAFDQARELLSRAAQHCREKTSDELLKETQSQLVKGAESS